MCARALACAPPLPATCLTGVLCCHVRRQLQRQPAPGVMRVGSLRQKWAHYSMALESPSLITDNIYLGDRSDAQDAEGMIERGVSFVLNAARQLPNYHEDRFIYLHLELVDSPEEDITPHFQAGIDFIREAVAARARVLVHCIAGVSRSVAVVCAYLMAAEGMRLKTAFELVRRHGCCCYPCRRHCTARVRRVCVHARGLGLTPRAAHVPRRSSAGGPSFARTMRSCSRSRSLSWSCLTGCPPSRPTWTRCGTSLSGTS